MEMENALIMLSAVMDKSTVPIIPMKERLLAATRITVTTIVKDVVVTQKVNGLVQMANASKTVICVTLYLSAQMDPMKTLQPAAISNMSSMELKNAVARQQRSILVITVSASIQDSTVMELLTAQTGRMRF